MIINMFVMLGKLKSLLDHGGNRTHRGLCLWDTSPMLYMQLSYEVKSEIFRGDISESSSFDINVF